MGNTVILTRRGVFGGFTAVWREGTKGTIPLPIEAHLAVGKGGTRDEAIRNLFQQVPSDVVRRELMPFVFQHSSDFHPA